MSSVAPPAGVVLTEAMVSTKQQPLEQQRSLNVWSASLVDVSLIARMPLLEVVCLPCNLLTDDAGRRR